MKTVLEKHGKDPFKIIILPFKEAGLGEKLKRHSTQSLLCYMGAAGMMI